MIIWGVCWGALLGWLASNWDMWGVFWGALFGAIAGKTLRSAVRSEIGRAAAALMRGAQNQALNETQARADTA